MRTLFAGIGRPCKEREQLDEMARAVYRFKSCVSHEAEPLSAARVREIVEAGFAAEVHPNPLTAHVYRVSGIQRVRLRLRAESRAAEQPAGFLAFIF